MADLVGAVFWLADANQLRLLEVSDAYDRIWGRDRHRLYANYEEFFTSLHPDDRDRVRAVLTQDTQPGEDQFELSYRMVRPDGEVRWLRDRRFWLRDDQGVPQQLAGFTEDVTAIKQSEITCQQIEQERDRFWAIGSDLQVITGSDGYFRWVSPTFERLLGWTAAEMTTHPWTNFVHPDDVAPSEQETTHLLSGGETFEFENRYRHKNGSYRWLLWRARPQPQEQVIYGTAIDITDRKRAETALRDSEARFRTLTATIPQLIWTAAPNGSVDYLSQQWAAYIGLPPEQLYDWRWQDVVHPDDLPNTLQEWHHSLETGVPLEIKHRFRFHTGEWRWQLVRGTPVKQQGQVTKWVGTCTDIQAEVDTQTALHQSEARLHAVAANFPSGAVFIVDRDLRYQLAEGKALAEAGFTSEDFVNKTIWEALDPSLAASYEPYFRQTLRGNSFRWEHESHGHTYISHGVPLYRQGAVEAMLAVSYDITDRKQIEEALQDRQQRLTLATEAAQLGVFEWNVPQDIAIWENDRMYEIFGHTRADGTVSRQDFFAHYLHPDDAAAFATTAAKGMQTGSLREVICRIRRRDGETVWVEFNGQFECAEDGAPLRLVGVAADISDRVRAEAEREQLLTQEQAARTQAEAANRVKDEFLAILSHELRSPLNPILGWTRLLQSGRLDATRQREALNTIERNAKLQTQLVEDLLDISRIMQGKLTLTAAPVDLAMVITAATETVQLAAEAKGIDIVLDLAPDVLVFGDAARLQQVIWNLLANAVKFTSQGSVTVALQRLDQTAQIRVADTGKGIAPEFLPRVFDYFRQEDGSIARKFGGLGLGLAIVRQIVEMHGGTVTADSSGKGQGATFTLELPLLIHHVDQLGESSKQHRLPADDSALAGLHILLVDDEQDAREVQTALLEQNGAQVVAVTSGHEALQALERFTPDLLISDIGMADMDGYTLMQQLRSRSPNGTLTIRTIALTAFATETDRQRALQAGFQLHLTKPVATEELIWAIVSLTE